MSFVYIKYYNVGIFFFFTDLIIPNLNIYILSNTYNRQDNSKYPHNAFSKQNSIPT